MPFGGTYALTRTYAPPRAFISPVIQNALSLYHKRTKTESVLLRNTFRIFPVFVFYPLIAPAVIPLIMYFCRQT